MKIIMLCDLDENIIEGLLKGYRTHSRADYNLDIYLYRQHTFEGFSTSDLAELMHMNRSTIYRRIKKVDHYLREQCANKK